MSGCSSCEKSGRGGPAFRRALALRVAVTLGVLGCLPDRELASYAAEGGMERESVASANSNAAASPPSAPAGPLGSEAVSGTESSRDGGVVAADVPSSAALDAAPSRALSCRDECQCERSGERDFMFCSVPVSFALAEARCADAGGTLASVDGAEQNEWLTAQMQARDADDFWLSGTDAEDEGVWRWADGRVFYPALADAGAPFLPWDDQQPNDLNGEDCMRSVGGLWRDLSCDDALAYVCQG